jgi:hypothetical protein
MDHKKIHNLYMKYREFITEDKDIRCEDGWSDIIENFLKLVKNHIRLNNPKLKFRISCIKEKFGTMRIYAAPTDQRIDGMISMACAMSETTCELCGSPKAKLRKSLCARTLCDLCNDLVDEVGEK